MICGECGKELKEYGKVFQCVNPNCSYGNTGISIFKHKGRRPNVYYWNNYTRFNIVCACCGREFTEHGLLIHISKIYKESNEIYE